MLSKSLIQFSVEGQRCVISLSFDLRPKYGGGNEDNGNLLLGSGAHKVLFVPSKSPFPQFSVSSGNSMVG